MHAAPWRLLAAALFVLAACDGGASGTPDDGPAPDVPGDAAADPGAPDLPDARDAAPDTPPDAPDLPVDAADAPAPTDAGPDLPPYPEPEARVLYDLFATPVDGFFPWDRHLDAEGSIRVDLEDFSNANLPILAEGPYPAHLALVHGFATYAPIVFQASVPVDPASLPADFDASLAGDASVRLYAVRPDGTPGDRIAFLARAMPFPEDGYYLVRVLPAWPLAADRVAVVVTDALRSQDGPALGRPRGFAQVLGIAALPVDAPAGRVAQVQAEAARLAPLLAALPDADRVLAAATFTTAPAHDDDAALPDLFARFVPPALPPDTPYDVDADDDGTPDVVTNGGLAGCSMTAAEMGWAIRGTFRPLNLTDPADGHWVREGDGWKVFPSQDVAFALMVPAGDGPFPVVVAQHGIQSDIGGMCGIARDLVRSGMAVLRFDFPRHGSRGRNPDSSGWGFDFLSIDDPVRIRENFRQGALDIASVLVLLDALAADATLWDGGAPRVDPARIGFAGHSLGALIGLLYLPFAPSRVQAFVSNVGGLGMWHLVELFVQKTFGDVFLAQGYINAGEHAIWAGDGVAYADRFLTGFFRPGAPAVRLLAQEVVGDDVIANASTEVLARVAALPQVGTVHVAIPGCATEELADAETGLFQYTGINHHAITSNHTAPEADLMRRQLAHYLDSWFRTGRAEILGE